MTRPHDMKHLEQLFPVALADVQHLRMKEATYQGSWKRSGGRSAWFMLKRKIDRLLEMMKRPETPAGFAVLDIQDMKCKSTYELDRVHLKYLYESYKSENVFAKIRETPGGEDGSVLAEVRDLRRYLLLVEAEMVSRGAIEEPNEGEDLDIYSRVARVTGEDRQLVKKILLAAAYSGQVNFLVFETSDEVAAREGMNDSSMHERRVPRYTSVDPDTRINVGGQPSREDPTAYESRFAVIGEDGSEIAVRRNLAIDERLAFEGLDPWLILKSEWLAAPEIVQEKEALSALYDEHGAGLMKLSPDLGEDQVFKLTMAVHSNSSVASSLIRRAMKCYVSVEGTKMHVLDVRSAPPDYRSAWPYLKREYNAYELSLLENWMRLLYAYSEAETKWKIKGGFEAWTREA